MVGDVLAVIDFLEKKAGELSTVSALFDYMGHRQAGDGRIDIEKIDIQGDNSKWFYRVKPIKDYIFVYAPLIPSLYIDYGTKVGAANPDANIFRFVGNALSYVISDGNPNVMSDFIVVGYKPKALLKKTEAN